MPPHQARVTFLFLLACALACDPWVGLTLARLAASLPCVNSPCVLALLPLASTNSICQVADVLKESGLEGKASISCDDFIKIMLAS